MKKVKLSKISAIHYAKLLGRSLLFILALIGYITNRINGKNDLFEAIEEKTFILMLIWIIYVVEMCLRFFPSKYESMGSQKQFKKNYIPVENNKIKKISNKSALIVAVAWILFNSVIGLLYYLSIIDKGILLLISLLYGVCDMICILFFCPFQTWFMKNRCCNECRIYNWDFLMMFTPYIFIPHLYTWSLLFLSILLFLRWEITLYRHPERFSSNTNKNLQCINCQEKLCSHKKQLILLWKSNKFISKIKEKTISSINELKEKKNEK